MELHPIGSRENPAYSYDLLSAVALAKSFDHKIWVKLRGDYETLYEVWPGGRNIAWPKGMLRERDRRRETKKAETA
jgi:hypothetical protein